MGGGDVGTETLKERQKLGQMGLVVAVVVLDRSTGALVNGPTLHGRGLTDTEMGLLPRAGNLCREMLLELSPAVRSDDALVKEELTRGVRRTFKESTQKRPTVLPVVVKL
jgi:ribonuclease J